MPQDLIEWFYSLSLYEKLSLISGWIIGFLAWLSEHIYRNRAEKTKLRIIEQNDELKKELESYKKLNIKINSKKSLEAIGDKLISEINAISFSKNDVDIAYQKICKKITKFYNDDEIPTHYRPSFYEMLTISRSNFFQPRNFLGPMSEQISDKYNLLCERAELDSNHIVDEKLSEKNVECNNDKSIYKTAILVLIILGLTLFTHYYYFHHQ